MIRNFLLILKRFKTSSIINILGLSAALMVFFVVLLQVYYDFTFDKGYKNSDRIVQLNIYNFNEGNIATNTNFQIPTQVSSRFPEVEAFCMSADWGEQLCNIIKNGTGMPESHEIFPTMLHFQMVYLLICPKQMIGVFNPTI